MLRQFALSPDGNLMAAAGFAFDTARKRIVHRVWIRDLKQDTTRREIEVPAVDLFCLAFAPDGATLATGGFAGGVQLWDLVTGDCLATLKLGNSAVRSLSFAPDGKVLAVCEERKGTRLWNLAQAPGDIPRQSPEQHDRAGLLSGRAAHGRQLARRRGRAVGSWHGSEASDGAGRGRRLRTR